MKRLVPAALLALWMGLMPAAAAVVLPAPGDSAPGRSLRDTGVALGSVRVALMGIAVEVFPGYVRVSEVINLEHTGPRAITGEFAFGVPAAARYIAFHEGLNRPRVEGTRIVDRLTLSAGAHRVAFSYSVAGSGDVDLSRPAPLPIDRLLVLATAPARIRSPQLAPLAPLGAEGRTVERAAGRGIGPGALTLRVDGVPAARHWAAPAAAAFLAAILAAGLAAAAVAQARGRRGAPPPGGVVSEAWNRYSRRG